MYFAISLRLSGVFLPVVHELFEAVSVDLSVHAMLIVKALAPQLVSKDDSVRELAAKAVVSMGKQMSDASAVRDVVKHLMGLLKGTCPLLRAVCLCCGSRSDSCHFCNLNRLAAISARYHRHKICLPVKLIFSTHIKMLLVPTRLSN